MSLTMTVLLVFWAKHAPLINLFGIGEIARCEKLQCPCHPLWRIEQVFARRILVDLD